MSYRMLRIIPLATLMSMPVVAKECGDKDASKSLIAHVVELGKRSGGISKAEQELCECALRDGIQDAVDYEQIADICLRVLQQSDSELSHKEVKRLCKLVERELMKKHSTYNYEVGDRAPVQTSFDSEEIDAVEDVLQEYLSFAGPLANATNNTQARSFNFAAGGDPNFSSPQGGTAIARNASVGFNFASGQGTATSDRSDGFNFASPRGTATSSSFSDGFNFASARGIATSDSSVGFNLASRFGTATSDGSAGFNFASEFGTATSDNADGYNFASRFGTATSSNFSDGFNFASASGTATSDRSGGFNFASPQGTATSSNSSDGFNFASESGTATSDDSLGLNFASSRGKATSNRSSGFNLASLSGEATSENSDGVNFASARGKATSNRSSGFNFAGESTGISTANAAHSYNIALTGDVFSLDSITIDDGDDFNDNRLCNIVVGSGSALTINNTSQTAAINAIADGGTLTNPGNGVNVDVGNGEFRLFDISSVSTSGGNTLELNGNVVQEVTSTRKHKKNIRSLDTSTMKRALQLLPVRFSRIQDSDDQIEYGLIAEDAAEVMPEIVVYDGDGEPHGISYRQLAVLALNAVQQQQQQLCEYDRENREFREALHNQQQENHELREMVEKLCAREEQRNQDIKRLYQLVGAADA